MPRYLVERLIPNAGELTAKELQTISQQILRVQGQFQAGIQWVFTVFTADGMVDLYIADDEQIIKEHARLCGLPIQRMSEISAVIGPKMNDLH